MSLHLGTGEVLRIEVLGAGSGIRDHEGFLRSSLLLESGSTFQAFIFETEADKDLRLVINGAVEDGVLAIAAMHWRDLSLVTGELPSNREIVLETEPPVRIQRSYC